MNIEAVNNWANEYSGLLFLIGTFFAFSAFIALILGFCKWFYNQFIGKAPVDKQSLILETLREIVKQNENSGKVSKSIASFNEISDKEETIKLLKVLMKRSTAGFHSNIEIAKFETTVGTAGFRLFPVAYEKDIKIFDLIGGIDKNRISVVMKNRNKIKIIILDS